MKEENVDVHVLHKPKYVLHDVGCPAGTTPIPPSPILPFKAMDNELHLLMQGWVSFQHLNLLQAGTLNTATLNVGQTGLTPYVMQYVLWFMEHMHIDVFFLQDTRLLPSSAEALMKSARTHLGSGSVCKSSAGRSGVNDPAQSQSFNERVGEQVVLISR